METDSAAGDGTRRLALPLLRKDERRSKAFSPPQHLRTSVRQAGQSLRSYYGLYDLPSQHSPQQEQLAAFPYFREKLKNFLINIETEQIFRIGNKSVYLKCKTKDCNLIT